MNNNGNSPLSVRYLNDNPEYVGRFSDVLRQCYEHMAESAGGRWGYIPDEIVERVLLPKAGSDYLWQRANTGMHYWFVEADGEVLGTIGLNREPGARYDSSVTRHRIEQLAVTPDHRNNGVGRVLMDHARTFADEQGMEVFMFAPVPFHDSLLQLGFEHHPQGDHFLPEDVEKPNGFNERWSCACTDDLLRNGTEAEAKKFLIRLANQKIDCNYLIPKSNGKPA